MVSIDGKRIVFSTTFLVPTGQKAVIETEIEGTPLRIGVTFLPLSEGDERGGRWMNDDGFIHIEFLGWNSPTGSCLSTPAKFGELGEERMFFQVVHHFVDEQNLAQLFIYLGA